MTYLVKLNHFEGPLDLLLYLIKVNEIDIFNIDIFVLTQEYLNYLRLMEFNNLKDASDFLEMAAHLIEIKSIMLLPNEEEKASEDEEDPVKSLQQRLIEYEQIKNATSFFESRFTTYQTVHTNYEWKRLQPFYEDVQKPLRMDVASLVVLYEYLLKTLPDKKAVKVEAKLHKVSIDEKIQELTTLLNKVKFALFQGFYKKFASRYELVVYILSVLEMVRWGKLNVYQQSMLGPIWLYLPDFKVQDLPLTREQKATLLENNYPEDTVGKEESVNVKDIDVSDSDDNSTSVRTIQGASVKDISKEVNSSNGSGSAVEENEDFLEDVLIEDDGIDSSKLNEK